jgi:hypothetical protein
MKVSNTEEHATSIFRIEMSRLGSSWNIETGWFLTIYVGTDGSSLMDLNDHLLNLAAS